MTLRRLREQQRDPESGRKVSGEKIAQQIGVSAMTYYAWERGDALPSGENLFKLEKILPGAISVLLKTFNNRDIEETV